MSQEEAPAGTPEAITANELDQAPAHPDEPVESAETGESTESTDDFPAAELSDEDYLLNFLGSDKFELPKETPEEVRAALKNLEKSLNKGWTEKNMSLAEQRRAFLDQQQSWQMQQAAAREVENETLELRSLQKQLEAYDKLAPTDWQSWSQSDPAAAQQGFMTYQTLKGQVERQAQALTAKQQEAMTRQQQHAQRWLADAEQKLATDIPDWSRDKARSIAEFVSKTYLNTGTPIDDSAYQVLNWHPGLVRMANEAMAYRNSVTRAKTPPKVNAPQPVSKASGGSAPAAKDPERMSDAEWIAQRTKSIEMANIRRFRR